jgi:uncharacterized delta-60 repeat protein
LLAITACAGPGAWDSSFLPTVNGAVYASAVQPDGRILLGGAFTAVNGSSYRYHLARLFADGSLDTTFFNSGGGVSSTIWCLAVQTDGRIVIGGDFTSVNATTRTRVARLNSSGTLDGSFVPTNTITGSVLALAAQSDNKVIIGGSFSSTGFPAYNARLNADGTVDTAFSSYPNGAVNAIGIQSDGKIVIGGAFTTVNGASRYRIARLNADGSLDNTFQNALAGASATVRCLQIQTDGKILIGGDFTTVNGTSRSYVARLTSTGALDTGFVSYPGAGAAVYALAVQPDSSVVIGGSFSTYATYSLTRVARLYADGTRDTSYATSGINNLVQTLAVQSDGGLLVGGTFTTPSNSNQPYFGRLYGNLYPPEFIGQPISRNTNVGATISFSATLNNPTPSNYQWRKDGANITGATGMSYLLNNVQFGDAGSYSVFVNNSAGGKTSSNAVLNVGITPAITGQPASLVATQGQSATFTVTATGTPLNYFWKKGGTFITGATSSAYTIASVVASNAATYTCQVSNFLGSVTSTGATLVVYSPPVITVQPVSQTVGVGSNFTVSVTATGNPTPACQWNKDGGDIPGATNTSYSVTGAQTNHAGGYSVVLTNIFGVVTSSVANISVLYYAPTITAQPIGQTLLVGSNSTLTVTATGTAPLAYQWRKDGDNLSGANGTSHTVTAAQTNDTGAYTVVVTNAVGSVTSTVAQVNVGYAPVIVQQPSSASNYQGGIASFSCTVTGSLPMNLQWLLNGAPAQNQTNSTITSTNLQSSDFGFYALTATNIFGGTISSNAELRDSFARTWTSTGDLTRSRVRHTATLLSDGRVLVAGGYDNSQILISSAELYNPSNGTWTTAGKLATGRYLHTATLMPNGKILVAGGASTSGNPVSSVEIFDPATMNWTAANGLSTPRYAHTASLLPNGKVLVAAGVNLGGYLASCELFDAETVTWTPVGAMAVARAYHRAVLLPDGKVLAEAGYGPGYLSSAELYEPVAGTWTLTGTMITARWYHTATLLSNGQVLVAGGAGNGGQLSRAEVYSPAAGTWTATNSMISARSLHTATLLPNGGTLIVGGQNSSGVLSSAEVYGAASGTWTGTSPLLVARTEHTATLLFDGRVLVVGGSGTNGTLSSAELYEKATAIVTLGSLMQTYDGRARSATATTIPTGLAVNFTYNSSANAPTNSGSYTVFARIIDPSYQGSVTNTLVILPAPAPIVLTDATIQPNGAFQLAFTNTPGLSFSVLATTNVALSSVSWTVLGSATETPLGSGQFQFIDSQATNGPQRFYRIRSQ